jgi:NADPH:quinone reductase-like Zn-dependent oxidoreductase
MVKRLSLAGSTLRARTREEKAALVARFAAEALPGFAAGDLRVVVDGAFGFAHAADAHRRMEASEHVGKIILEPDAP